MYYRTVIGTACIACLEEGLCIGMVSVCLSKHGWRRSFNSLVISNWVAVAWGHSTVVSITDKGRG